MRSVEYHKLHKELHHTISMYGNACINGDKENAKKFLGSIKDILEILNALTNDLEKAETKEDEYAALYTDIAEVAEMD